MCRLRLTSKRAILNGESVQMTAQKSGASVPQSLLEWTSENPGVISCTSSGKITGLKKGYARITVKEKYGGGRDSVTVYCAERLKTVLPEDSTKILVFISSVPNIFPIQNIILNIPPLTESITYKVCGVYDSYFYVEYSKGGTFYAGFISQYFLSSSTASSEVFKELSASQLNIFCGQSKTLTTNYNGNVKWSVSNSNIISYNSSTGEVYAKAPGIATISATANGKTLTCTVRSIFKWKKEWQGTAKDQTYVYKADEKNYVKSTTVISGNNKFTVKGDLGNSDGWAYGVSTDGVWGYVPIKDISTKNTVSYHNSLGWAYPLQNKSYNYISSPYAPRETDLHRGFDISTGGNSTNISGQPIVAAFDGVVKKANSEINSKDGCGYYICITSNTVDPVTGKKITAIYMHMKSKATFYDKDQVKKGDIIGYVGNTGNSTGPHLHFEANNWNAGIGDSGRSDFTYTINPIFFYMNMEKNGQFSFNSSCYAQKNGYGFYFYNYNK